MPGAPGAPEPADKNNSASQMSFDNQLGNFNAYVAILDKVPSYSPQEADLKVSALKGTAADLRAKNDAVSSAFVAVSNSRGVRDQLLYKDDGCVVNTALLAKAYASAALGNASQLFKQIKRTGV